jgi:LDH2 family malate/lactate/ureidoglycolate dehydrogenase
MYCERLSAGVAHSDPKIEITRITPAVALFDGGDGLGLVIAPRAMALAIQMAKSQGIGLVGVRRSGHFGMASLYTQQAAQAGQIGIALTNGSPALPPWGGAKPFFGTSPLSIAAPTHGRAAPFCVDMAMSVVARGKLKFAAQRGHQIPAGLALDNQGQPTTDGAAAFDGVVLPFGGMKGAALAWAMDVLAGVLTGAAYGGDVANPFRTLDRPQNAGHLFIAIRANLFLPMDSFVFRMDDLANRCKALPHALGFDEILSPGEPELRRASKNRKNGVALTPDVTDDLAKVAAKVGIDWPFNTL